MNYNDSFIYRICEWIMKLAFVNLLWISFSMLGFIFLGFFPSTIAMFFIIRKWIIGQRDIPILKTFWDTYKNEWIKSNVFGVLLIGIFSLLVIDFSIVNSSSNQILFLQWSKYPLLLIMILLSLWLLYAIPSYVHYNVSLPMVLKNAFLIMLINPYYNVVMLLCFVLLFLLFKFSPPIILFFGGSVSAFIIMWACFQSFLQVDRKREKLKTTSKQH